MAQQLGAGGLTLENKTFYEKELLYRAVPQFVHLGWGVQKTIPPRGSNNLEWRRMERPAVATTALTEGTPPSSTAVTWTNVVATIQQYGAYARFSEVAMRQSIDEILSETVEVWGENMGDTLDIIARNVLIAGTTVQYAGAAVSRGAVSSYLTEAEIREAVATLKRQNTRRIARAGGRFVGIAAPEAMSDFMGSPSGNLSLILQRAGVRGDANPLFTGDAFDYLGVRFLESSNARVFGCAGWSLSTGRVGVFTTLIMGEGYYGEVKYGEGDAAVIVHPPGSGGAGTDPLNQFGSVGWKAPLAVRILNDSFAVRIEHGASQDLQAGNT